MELLNKYCGSAVVFGASRLPGELQVEDGLLAGETLAIARLVSLDEAGGISSHRCGINKRNKNT